MKKMLFLFNPYAGKGKFADSLITVLSQFEEAGYEVEVYQTKASGDGAKKIQSEYGSYDRIVVAGGDGMLHEVINAVLKLPASVTLGYIPTGTINDFAATYGMPQNPIEAAKIAVSDQLQWVDAGNFNNCSFSYVAAFGIATQVAYGTDQKAKNRFGKLAYIINALRYMTPSCFAEASTPMVVEHGNTLVTGEFVFGAISNSLSIAGMDNFIGDHVVLDDGLLEGFFVKKPKTVMELFQVIKGILLHDLSASCFYHMQADTIIIHSQPTAWTLDGEYGGVWDSAEIRTINKGVHLAAP